MSSTTARPPFGTVLVVRNALLREVFARILSSTDFQVLASSPSLDDLSRLLPSAAQILILDFAQQTLVLRGSPNGNNDDRTAFHEEAKDGAGERDDDRCANGCNGHDTVASAPRPETNGSNAALLSPRQKSILRHLITGDSNKTIARKTQLAEATVKVHVKAILRKIQVHNRTQAAMWAINNGALMLGKDVAAAMLPAESPVGTDRSRG
jgi:DNA-binding CsgD family transcriptional regulator